MGKARGNVRKFRLSFSSLNLCLQCNEKEGATERVLQKEHSFSLKHFKACFAVEREEL